MSVQDPPQVEDPSPSDVGFASQNKVPNLTLAQMVEQLESRRDNLKGALAKEVSAEKQANTNAKVLRTELRDTERLLKAAKPPEKKSK